MNDREEDRLHNSGIQRSPVWGRRFGHAQVNWSHGRLSNRGVKDTRGGADWKKKKNWTKQWRQGEISPGRAGEEGGKRKRDIIWSWKRSGQSDWGNRGRGVGLCWGAELSPEQTEANRGAVVWVRVGQGRGQQHRDVKCDRSILGLRHRSPSLLWTRCQGQGSRAGQRNLKHHLKWISSTGGGPVI